MKLPLCVGSGQVISASNYYAYEESFYGIFVISDAFVEPVTFEFDDNGSGYENYTVADGKKLVITNIWMSEFAESNMRINGILFAGNIFNSLSQDVNKQLAIPIIVESGSTITIPNNHSSFNGYIVDEDYFENCGGGGGSVGTPSGVDSAMVADMIASMNIPTYVNGNVSFGDYENINLDWTYGGGPETETSIKQVEKDGFLYVQTNGSGEMHLYISDTTQSNEINLFQTILHENVVVPIKKDIISVFGVMAKIHKFLHFSFFH